MSTPNYSLPFPVLNDVPNVPQHIQALAEATDTALAAVDARHFGTQTRNSDSGELAITTDTTDPVTITAAPAGLYLASGLIIYSNTDTNYHNNYGQVMIGAASYEYWRYDSADAYFRTMTQLWLFVHGGGDLSVVMRLRGSTFNLRAGCRTQVAKVGG